MNLIESLVCCALLAVFSALTGGMIITCSKTYFLTQELKHELSRDKFLTEGFVKLCKEKDGDVLKDSLIEWKKICLAMWPLDFLTITKSGDCFLEKWSFNGKITLVKFSADESTIKN